MPRGSESGPDLVKYAHGFEQAKEQACEISPEMEALFEDAVEVIDRLEKLTDSAEAEKVDRINDEVARFAGRRGMDVGEAFSLLEKMRGGTTEPKEEKDPQTITRESKKVRSLVDKLRSDSIESVDDMREIVKVFDKNIDISAVENIIAENEGDINLIKRQLTELQQTLIETVDQLEGQLVTEEESDLFDDFDELGKRREKQSSTTSKKEEEIVSTPELRKKERQVEFITKFVNAFRCLQAESINDFSSFRDRLHWLSIDVPTTTGQPESKSLYDFICHYGDRNKGTDERLHSLFELFNKKQSEFNPYTFARHVLLHEGGGSYTRFVNEDPPKINWALAA
ncbi:MAG: hypothetical protein HQ530_04605 [Parcubacteria group bacterium]|nr:hypothetical protein [Parcubacteria group bacterium]